MSRLGIDLSSRSEPALGMVVAQRHVIAELDLNLSRVAGGVRGFGMWKFSAGLSGKDPG